MNDSGLAKPLEQTDEVVERTLKRHLESQSSSDRVAGESPSAAAFRHELDKAEEHHRSDAYFQPKRWWFTATACPLVAGTFGPVASLMSVCALVQSWRLKIPPGGSETAAERVPDPTWWAGLLRL